MDVKEIQELIKIVSDSGISDFELESRDYKIKMKKGSNTDRTVNITDSKTAETQQKTDKSVNQYEIKDEKYDEESYFIKSPIVGTFYASSSPDAKPFVEKGMHIKKGTVMCIIEAMKLMNEIESDVDGTVTEVVASNGDMVEFGQPLFAIKLQQEIKAK